jgi:UDPglucose 6-dehydrogenase
MTKIAFVGLSHLGLNYAAAALKNGFRAVCYDPDSEIIKQADTLELDYSEPGLKDVLTQYKDKILFTNEKEDLSDCDIIYISRDVPTDESGNSDLAGIKNLIQIVDDYANESACLVILCQVPPGFTRSLEYPQERLFCHVETLIFGQALHRASEPERIIIGANSSESEIPDVFLNYLQSFNCPILKMRYESAELTKISINLFLVSSVVTTNLISDICEKIGADWFEIQAALKLDKRIGEYAYLSPGLGIAGGNLERDLNTTAKLSYIHGTHNDIVPNWIEDCFYRRDWVLRILFNEVLPKHQNASISILGISYKENTNSIKNSPSIYLMQYLRNLNVKAFDPVVKEAPFKEVEVLSTIDEALKSDILIIMTPWEQFKSIDINKLSGIKVLIDPFNCFKNNSSQLVSAYYSIGRDNKIVA